MATKPHGLVCFPRLTLKAVGGMSRMEIDRSYRSSRVTEESIPSWKEMQKLRERGGAGEIGGHNRKEKKKMSTVSKKKTRSQIQNELH